MPVENTTSQELPFSKLSDSTFLLGPHPLTACHRRDLITSDGKHGCTVPSDSIRFGQPAIERPRLENVRVDMEK
jgi:hypothetical protein